MAILLRTRVIVWARAAARCSFEGCGRNLVIDATQPDPETLVGELAHIVGQSKEGPRGDDPLPIERRDDPANLILFCTEHHTIVDAQTNAYTVDTLRAMKAAHEARVSTALEPSERERFQVLETVANYVDHWGQQSELDEWRFWTHRLLEPVPHMKVEVFRALEELGRWILSRVWPRGFERLRDAFANFKAVLEDLLYVFARHVEEKNEIYWTEKFYRLPEYDKKVWDALHEEFELHVDLVRDLTLELTRAANWLCAEVRATIDRSYRLKEGVLLVDSGPYRGFEFITHRVEYRAQDFEGRSQPYAGLDDFETTRFRRDLSLASSQSEDGEDE